MPSEGATIRRKHLKSRAGCAQCKRRRIKCDEVSLTGTCGSCQKSRLFCSYTPSTTESQPQPIAAIETPILVDTYLIDLELMHNFTSSTANTLSDHVPLQECFATAFVEIGLRHDFLLHAILALSAFHKVHILELLSDSSLFPVDRYIAVAHMHHTKALHSFSQQITHIGRENCHALFACACLLFVMSLARPREGNEEMDTSRYAEWVNLIRGLRAILEDSESHEWLAVGPLAPLFHPDPETPESHVEGHLSTTAQLKLDELSQAMFESSENVTIAACQAHIDSLRNAFTTIGRLKLALWWPSTLSREYMALLEGKNSEALMVMAYYCVLMNSLNHRWWIRGWPVYMLESIRLMVGGKWQVWLDWPLQQIKTNL